MRDRFCGCRCRQEWRITNNANPKLQFIIDSIAAHGDSDACLEWPFGTNKHRYGTISSKSNGDGDSLVSRVVFKKFNGPLADNECALHSCDNPPCYSPKHLWKGTKGDNTQDMMRKGRHGRKGKPGMRGQQHPMRKLSADDVLEIRKHYDPTKKRTGAGALAKRFGVNRNTIANAAGGKSWSDLGV
jgi:hypothetical protein